MGVLMVAYLPLIAACLLVLLYFTMSRTRQRDPKGKILGLIIVIVGVALALLITTYNGLLNRPLSAIGLASYDPPISDGLTAAPAEQGRFYGIMFDAGSTGSRIHVFYFIDQGAGKTAKYMTEKFIQVKGGLGEYAQDPVKGAQSLVSMLDEAKAYVPEDLWATTPIALKATAGLRALPEAQSTALLQEVNNLFDKYPFKKSQDSVAIMDGTDEGKFIWFTVNYLAGVLGDEAHMVGVMDLGGGSTQITLLPSLPATVESAPEGFLSDVDILGQQKRLYSHSYPLGLMAGRYQVIGGSPDKPEAISYTSLCLPEGYRDQWKFNNRELNVSGLVVTGSRYDQCYQRVKTVVDAQNIHKVGEVSSRPFWTVSYYHDRAVEAGLISLEEGGVIKVEDYFTAATKACTSPSVESPWQCLDLCFISSLLHDGFGFNKDTSITLKKKIEGNEISWALGAMFDWFGRHKSSEQR